MEKGKLNIKDLLKLWKNTQNDETKKEINERLYLNLMETIKNLRDKIKEHEEEDSSHFTPSLNKVNYILYEVPNNYVLNLDKSPEVNRGYLEGTFEKIEAYENEINTIISNLELEREKERKFAEEEATRHYSFDVIEFHENANKDVKLFYSALAEINENYWPIVSKLEFQRGYDDMAVIVGTNLHEYWRPKSGRFGIVKPKEIEEYEFILNLDLTEERNKDRKRTFEHNYIRNATQLILRIQKFTNEVVQKILDPNQNVVPYLDDIVDLKEIKHEDIEENEKFLNTFRGKTKKEALEILNNFINKVVEELKIQELAGFMA